MTAQYVDVAVPVPLRRTFAYRVPEGQSPSPGCRVQVSFGRRRAVGVVVSGPCDAAPEGIDPARIKPLGEVIDATPVLSERVLALCAWMARYYHLPPGEAYLLPLPPAMSGGRKGRRPEDDPFKTEKIARYVREPAPGRRVGARMDAVLTWLHTQDEASARAVRDATGAGLDVLRRLEARGLVSLEERRVARDRFSGISTIEHPAPPLTAEQQAAVAAVQSGLGSYRGFLLVGVTGSGKTEVYLRLIRAVLDRGSSALVLVPEIALTPQLVQRFRARLGDAIAVLHSGLDPTARHEQWLRIQSGELRVVIGARSALFAPIVDLGLIFVDEEHDSSFKQDTAPRYHARDLALVRGHLEGCPVVLGTATPSLESWANVQRDKLERVDLARRVMDRPMPAVELVDLREVDTEDAERIFSSPLIDAIRDNVAAGQQTILFLNRRGFAAFVVCRACGEAISCPDCTVTMTWHHGRQRLVCHYCHRVTVQPSACTACKDDALQRIGFGTERVQAVLSELLPSARIARMDRDTTRGKALNRLLDRFRGREIDVLVGTQMVAKGHDFPGVTLVGVLLAEMSLRLPDFRAAERTFQLLTQIAGRAGRAEQPGRVLIQTFSPEHYALQRTVDHDAVRFLDAELLLRRDQRFPPFAHLALLRMTGPDRDAVWGLGERLVRALGRNAPSEVVLQGPLPAPIERIKGRWRVAVLARAATRSALSVVLDRALDALEADRDRGAVQVALDVDPYSFL